MGGIEKWDPDKEVNYAHGPMVLRGAFVQRPIIANPRR